jgi:hypothetical protein
MPNLARALPLTILAALAIPSRADSSAPPDYYAENLAGRKAAAKVSSMHGVYIDACDRPDALRHWWKPAATPALEAAQTELQHYRNIMSCKGIHIYDVPNYGLENAFWKAMDAGNATKAHELATALRTAAEALIVGDELISRRIREVQAYADDKSLPKATRAQLWSILTDARAEQRAKRYVSASLIIKMGYRAALASGAKRPDRTDCSFGSDPTRGC